jgi:hypothetical protein
MRKVERFRITEIKGPSDRGFLNQFHDYLFKIELDYGGAFKSEEVQVLVTLFDSAFFSLAHGDPHNPTFLDEGKHRLAHYVTGQLQGLLVDSSPGFPLRLNPTVEEVQELQEIDPNKVEIAAWHSTGPKELTLKKRVFISCGQHSAEEKSLGEAIATLAHDRAGIEGYFAEFQHSLDGVTKDIFNAIHSASAFIAVMHRRDKLTQKPDSYRASVWVEQEVAIAAFLVQSLGLRLPARVYVQKGILREGVRGYILLNPIEFDTADEVLTDLESFWPEVI